MRVALRISIPHAEGNEAIRSGRMAETIATFVQKWRPEAAYFYALNGRRGATFYLNLDDPSQIPSLAEPFIMGVNADVEVVPAMNLDDLKKGLALLEKNMQR